MFLIIFLQINRYMSSYTRINIRINPENPGVVVNTNQLTDNEKIKKNSLYGAQVPEKDRSQQRTQKNSKEKKHNETVSTKGDRTRYNPSKQEVAEAERQRDTYMKEMRDNKASTEMIYTSTHLLKQQNELIHQNQKIMHQLIAENKKSPSHNPREQKGGKAEREQLKQATESVNGEIEEIRKMRDEIVRVGRQIQESLESAKTGKPSRVPESLSEMNQHLKSKVDSSLKNIDLLSPEKFDLVNRFQNFNIEAYSQKLNELKKEIGNMQRESENVEKQLRTRVNNLEKLKVVPQLEAQLLEPYQKDIKKRLETIDLEEARKRVFSRLGEFDYFQVASNVADIGIEIQHQLDQFDFVCKQYKINVPLLKLDNKEIKALELKLPSILEEYKQQHGIVLKQHQTQPASKFQTMKQKQLMGSSKGEIFPHKRGSSQSRVQSIPSKPKDLSNQIPYKKVGKDPFKTVMQKKPVAYEKERTQIQNNIMLHDTSPKKPREQEEFDAYLENIKNEELQLLYKEKRDQLRRMKDELYEQSTEPLQHYTRISYPNRQSEEVEIDLKPTTPHIKNKPNPIANPRINESQYKEQDSIGSRIFDPNEGVIKEIGKEVLKEKLKGLIGKKRPVFEESSNKNTHILPPQHKQQIGQQMGAPSINSFAEGFLTVINNTFAEMNKGISSSLEKRRHPIRGQSPDHNQQKIKIPFPELEQIPKPPVFNLKFEAPQRQTVPMFPTFSSHNFPRPPVPIQRNDYSQYEETQIQPYSQMIDDNSVIRSQISNVPSDNSFV